MGKITSYHPSFYVVNEGLTYQVDVVCDDWYSDDDIRDELLRVFGSTSDLLVSLENGGYLKLLASSFIIDVSVVCLDSYVPPFDRVLDIGE